jgi:cysteinyl-tRNA synthetase
MKLKLYNTFAREKQIFEPLDPQHIKMYVCGPTVYDYAHIGNGRPYVIFDVLYRVLKGLYPKVTYARNITDIEDKIIVAAKKNNETISELTTRTKKMFLDDMAAINVSTPDIMPHATDHIAEMIDMISALIDKGHAYEKDGHVLFHVPSMKEYGKLSRQDRDAIVAGARVEVAPYKKDPSDFILWKPSDDDDPGWDSPWGRGRPGWHIECSAMIKSHLGDTIDIHAGGQDLIFPHHENEIAQSSCAHDGKQFCRYWLHNGMVQVNGKKMSKSLGNFYTVHELLDEVPGEAVRFFLLEAHYRQPFNFTKEGLKEAKQLLDRFYIALQRVEDIAIDDSVTLPDAMYGALLDDLNTPLFISHIHQIVSDLNKATSKKDKVRLKSLLRLAADLLGILRYNSKRWLEWQPASADSLTDDEIENYIRLRKEARVGGNYQEADRIRDLLKDKGIILEDFSTGTRWRSGG